MVVFFLCCFSFFLHTVWKEILKGKIFLLSYIYLLLPYYLRFWSNCGCLVKDNSFFLWVLICEVQVGLWQGSRFLIHCRMWGSAHSDEHPKQRRGKARRGTCRNLLVKNYALMAGESIVGRSDGWPQLPKSDKADNRYSQWPVHAFVDLSQSSLDWARSWNKHRVLDGGGTAHVLEVFAQCT